jgi:archaemetzincin
MVFLLSCQRDAFFSLKNNDQNKNIALQPLGEYNQQQLEQIRNQLSSFFNIRVLILKPIAIPQQFRDTFAEKYFADSLVSFLSKFLNDSITEIVGLTHKDIYTLRERTFLLKNEHYPVNESIGIFGLGYNPGKACVISDYRLMSVDRELLNNRLRKTIIHEMGHNLGLVHCADDTCLMSETNGGIAELNKVGGDYCLKCKKKLK